MEFEGEMEGGKGSSKVEVEAEAELEVEMWADKKLSSSELYHSAVS